MIPRVIHYCWFGGNPKPAIAKKCYNSWKRYCPNYEIIEWNESNYNINSAPLYVQQAYKAKKWAFVTDYARLQIVHEHGGIYLDTDVELVKQLDELLRNKAYFGFEGTEFINTGLGFGAEKGNVIIYEMMQDYMEIAFLLKNGEYDVTPCPQRNTTVFLRHGLKQNGTNQRLDEDTLILSAEYLCPLDNATRILRKTSNTVSIHHFDASWQSADQRKKHDKIARQRRSSLRKERIIYFPKWLLRKIIGDEQYEKIKCKFKN
ncbi:MAG: glycosyl transferase [Clostridia bacterium]|nr:glycosyl transferase [Clostridia bacterium]